MAEARALKFSKKGDYIMFCQTDDKSPLKWAWFCSRDPFSYAQLWRSTALGELRSTMSSTTDY